MHYMSNLQFSNNKQSIQYWSRLLTNYLELYNKDLLNGNIKNIISKSYSGWYGEKILYGFAILKIDKNQYHMIDNYIFEILDNELIIHDFFNGHKHPLTLCFLVKYYKEQGSIKSEHIRRIVESFQNNNKPINFSDNITLYKEGGQYKIRSSFEPKLYSEFHIITREEVEEFLSLLEVGVKVSFSSL